MGRLEPLAWCQALFFSRLSDCLELVHTVGWTAGFRVVKPLPSKDELAKILAAPGLRLTSALYVEGGPEASLYVAAGGVTVNEVGSYETGFREDDTNVAFWDIPNVVGFAAP